LGTVHVGCTNFNIKPAKYARRLSFVELSASFESIPRSKACQRIRAEAGPNMSFALRAHHRITHPYHAPIYRRIAPDFPGAQPSHYGFFQETHPVEEATKRLMTAAQHLDAKAIIFETPVEFSPTKENQERLVRFFSRLDREGRQMVWDPRGPWEHEQIAEAAAKANIFYAIEPFGISGMEDWLRGAQGDGIFLRLRGPQGRRQRYAAFELEELALVCRNFEHCYAVFSHAKAFPDAVAFLGALSQAPTSELLDEE
jgi:uncharacterized protein YecE (DUF72 family)